MKGDKICATCRSNYDFCPKCNKDKDKPLWYFTFCSENCHDIYETTSNFENGKINADEAKSKLDNLNLSKIDNFGESYKKSIIKIMNSVSINEDKFTEDVMVTEEKTEINIDEQVVGKEKNDITEEIIEKKVFKKSRNKMAKINVEE